MKKTVKVLDGRVVQRGPKDIVKPGKTFPCDEEEAARLIARGVVCIVDDKELDNEEHTDSDQGTAIDGVDDTAGLGNSDDQAGGSGDVAMEKVAESSLEDVLCEAIGQLDQDRSNLDHWTKSGVPQIAALVEITGLSGITAAERDAAFKAFNQVSE